MITRLRAVQAYVAPLCVTAAVAAAVVALFGADPVTTAGGWWNGIVGTPFTIGQTLEIASVLVLTGLAAAVPFSARLWNVGGEGQLYAGAVGAVTVALTMPAGASAWVAVVCALIGGTAAGAVWGLIPGALRAFLGASEMIVSLLLNFVAVLAAQFAIRKVFPDSTGQTSRPLRDGVALPQIWPIGGVDLGLPLVIVVVIATWFVMQRSTFGFSVRAAGAGIGAAELAGLAGRRVTFATFGLAGAFAGLAGALLILGGSGQLSRGISANYGFLGIAVALIAGLRILWVVPAGVALAALTVGSNSLEVSAGVPRAVGAVLVTVLVVSLLGSRAIGVKASR
jgi:ABC-type uncharacterized transport system permease subunit